MPEKSLRANGNDGFGTQSKKKKVVSPKSHDSERGSKGDQSESHRSNSTKDSDIEEIQGNKPPPLKKKKSARASTSRLSANGLTAAERALDNSGSDKDETPERQFIRSKRSPVNSGPSTSTAKRSRTTGPKLVADSMNQAAERVMGFEELNESDKLVFARIQTEQYPMRQEAMSIFNKECSKKLEPQHTIQVANELKKDETASFFCHMNKDYRWDWLKSEAGILQDYKEVQEGGEGD